MKREKVCKFLYVVSVLLIMGFGVRILVDYIKYDPFNDSAPFYVFIIERTVEFILPSTICFVVAKIIKKRIEDNK